MALIRTLLEAWGLDEVVAPWGVLHTEQDWNGLLSLTKLRFRAFIRVLFAAPCLVVLDGTETCWARNASVGC